VFPPCSLLSRRCLLACSDVPFWVSVASKQRRRVSLLRDDFSSPVLLILLFPDLSTRLAFQLLRHLYAGASALSIGMWRFSVISAWNDVKSCLRRVSQKNPHGDFPNVGDAADPRSLASYLGYGGGVRIRSPSKEHKGSAACADSRVRYASPKSAERHSFRVVALNDLTNPRDTDDTWVSFLAK